MKEEMSENECPLELIHAVDVSPEDPERFVKVEDKTLRNIRADRNLMVWTVLNLPKSNHLSLKFPILAILTVDNAVVDLETIEALYENVGIATCRLAT